MSYSELRAEDPSSTDGSSIKQQTVLHTEIRLFWDIVLCTLVGLDRHFIAQTMEVIRTSPTLVYSNEITQHYNPEGSNLHTRCCDSLISHTMIHTGFCICNTPNIPTKTTVYFINYGRTLLLYSHNLLFPALATFFQVP